MKYLERMISSWIAVRCCCPGECFAIAAQITERFLHAGVLGLMEDIASLSIDWIMERCCAGVLKLLLLEY